MFNRIKIMFNAALRTLALAVAVASLAVGALVAPVAEAQLSREERREYQRKSWNDAQERWRRHEQELKRRMPHYRTQEEIMEAHIRAKEAEAAAKKVAKLHDAVLAGDLNGIRQALDDGADINGLQSHEVYYGGAWEGKTALMLAAEKRQDAALRLLIKRGANVHARNEFKATALHYATSDTTSGMLLDAGADINARTNSRCTPRDYKLRQIVRLLWVADFLKERGGKCTCNKSQCKD